MSANRSRIGASASRSRVSEPLARGSSTVAPARSGPDGHDRQMLDRGGLEDLVDRRLAEQDVVDGQQARPWADRVRGWRCTGGRCRRAASRTRLGDARRQVYRGGGLPDPALLVGDGVDRAHLRPTLAPHAVRPVTEWCLRATPGRRGNRSGVGPTLCHTWRWRCSAPRVRGHRATTSPGARPSSPAAAAAAASRRGLPPPAPRHERAADSEQRGGVLGDDLQGRQSPRGNEIEPFPPVERTPRPGPGSCAHCRFRTRRPRRR